MVWVEGLGFERGDGEEAHGAAVRAEDGGCCGRDCRPRWGRKEERERQKMSGGLWACAVWRTGGPRCERAAGGLELDQTLLSSAPATQNPPDSSSDGRRPRNWPGNLAPGKPGSAACLHGDGRRHRQPGRVTLLQTPGRSWQPSGPPRPAPRQHPSGPPRPAPTPKTGGREARPRARRRSQQRSARMAGRLLRRKVGVFFSQF